jgi:hypothetical protein
VGHDRLADALAPVFGVREDVAEDADPVRLDGHDVADDPIVVQQADVEPGLQIVAGVGERGLKVRAVPAGLVRKERRICACRSASGATTRSIRSAIPVLEHFRADHLVHGFPSKLAVKRRAPAREALQGEAAEIPP